MRVTLILAVAIGIAAVAGRADAEKVRTNQRTTLKARPGEQAKVILELKSGQNMTLLSKDGRWLKVRVQGRTGYVTQSTVDMADDDEIVRNTRRRPFVDGRSKRRGFGGGAPDDRIGADALGEGRDGQDEEEEEEDEEEPAPRRKVAAKAKARDDEDEDEEEPAPRPKKAAAKPRAADEDEDEGEGEGEGEEDDAESGGDDEADEDEEEAAPARPTARVRERVAVYSDPDDESDEEFTARPDELLYPSDTKGDWTFVENDEGDAGWILTDLLEIEDAGGTTRRRTIDLRARVGFMFIQQGMRSQGSQNTSVPDNYNIGTSSVALSVGGAVLVPYKKRYVLGGEVRFDYAKTLFGGVFYDPDGPMMMPGVNTGVTVSNFNVRAVAGLDLRKKSGLTLLGRLGYRYQGFLITDVAVMARNPAKLPSEVVKAPTIGAAFELPRLTDKIGLRLAADAILFGSTIRQTKGLEDGASPAAKAVTAGAVVNYRWKKAMDLQATYDLHWMGVDFGPPLASSTRGHMGTRTTRTDFFHMVTFGVAMPF